MVQQALREAVCGPGLPVWLQSLLVPCSKVGELGVKLPNEQAIIITEQLCVSFVAGHTRDDNCCRAA